MLRANHRLLRRQSAAVHVRKISTSGRDAYDADEKRRRGDGDWAHVQGSVAKSAAQFGDQTFGFVWRWRRSICRSRNAATETRNSQCGSGFLSRASISKWNVDR